MKIVTFFLLLLTLPMAAMADNSPPLIYTRTTITITPKNAPAPATPLPWQKAAPPSGITFDVEVRDGQTLYNQEGWFNLSGMSQKNGILLMFDAPDKPPITRMTQYAPLDILMIDHEGTITQIVPNIKLSELDQDIVPTAPVLAFLFLQGGLCEKLSIVPGDSVQYKAFKKPPVILGVPQPSPASGDAPQTAKTPAARP